MVIGGGKVVCLHNGFVVLGSLIMIMVNKKVATRCLHKLASSILGHWNNIVISLLISLLMVRCFQF